MSLWSSFLLDTSLYLDIINDNGSNLFHHQAIFRCTGLQRQLFTSSQKTRGTVSPCTSLGYTHITSHLPLFYLEVKHVILPPRWSPTCSSWSGRRTRTCKRPPPIACRTLGDPSDSLGQGRTSKRMKFMLLNKITHDKLSGNWLSRVRSSDISTSRLRRWSESTR